jgi:hypothetical protein
MSDPRPLRSSPWFVGALILAIGWWVLDLAVLRAGVPHPLDDTWEDGIVARLLVDGHGFRSHMIYPPLWELRDPQTLTVPVLVHGPLMPLLLALPLEWGGPAMLDRIAWFGAVCAMLALFPLFRLTARFFDEPVAAAACALFTLSPLLIDAVNHYVSTVLGAFLVAWTLDLLVRERPRAIAAGVVAGACSLTRPEMVIAAPVLAFLSGWGGARAASPSKGTAGAHERKAADANDADRRAVAVSRTPTLDPPPHAGWAAAFRFLLAFAAVASWWWWERWRATGSPFFNLTSYLLASFSPAHPGDALVRDFTVPPRLFSRVLADALPTLWSKWAYTFPRAIRRALGTPADAFGWLVPAGFAAAWWRRETRRVAVSLALIAVIPLVAVTLIAPVRLYPVPFLPLYAIAATLGARWLVQRLPWARRPRAWLLFLALIAVPSAAIELKEQAALARSLERWLVFDRRALAGAHATTEERSRLMFSDTPDFVAWTTGRPTVWLTRAELASVFRPGAEPPPGMQAPQPEDTWYHRADGRDAGDQAGFRLAR